MAFVNISQATKQRRSQQIVNDLGNASQALFYTGTPPISPDLPASGVLCCTLTLANVAGAVTQCLGSIGVVFSGQGGTSGTFPLGIVGSWTNPPIATFTVASGAVSSVNLVSPGSNVSAITGFSFTNCPGLTTAAAEPIFSSVIWFNPVLQGIISAAGTLGYVRLQNGAGGGIIDMDVGVVGSGASVIVNAIDVLVSAPFAITSAVIFES